MLLFSVKMQVQEEAAKGWCWATVAQGYAQTLASMFCMEASGLYNESSFFFLPTCAQTFSTRAHNSHNSHNNNSHKNHKNKNHKKNKLGMCTGKANHKTSESFARNAASPRSPALLSALPLLARARCWHGGALVDVLAWGGGWAPT